MKPPDALGKHIHGPGIFRCPKCKAFMLNTRLNRQAHAENCPFTHSLRIARARKKITHRARHFPPKLYPLTH